MNKYRPLYFIFIISVLLHVTSLGLKAQQLPSYSADEPMRIQADEITYYRGENRFSAKGNVIIEDSQGRKTYAERFDADMERNSFQAFGHVKFETPEGTMEADEMKIDMTSKSGFLINGRLYISDGHYTIEGERIEMVGEGKFIIKNAKFTPCLCGEGEKPDWSITAKNTKVELEGYGKAKGPIFRIKDVPIFYIPAIAFPIKSERQTGLLVPRMGYSNRGGFDANIPFFWAISRSTDATVYADIFEKRGTKPGIEFRWAHTEKDTGIVNMYYLDDKREDENRWAFRTQGKETFPLKMILKWDLRAVSDNEYVPDFDRDDIGERADRELESRLLLERHFERANAYIFFSRFDDMQGDDVRDQIGHDDNDDLQFGRLPRGSFKFISQPLFGKPLYGSLLMQAENLYRRGPVLQDTNMNGLLDSGEQTFSDEFTGRFIFVPTAYYTLKPGGFLEIIPSLSLKGAGYTLPNGKNAWRGVPVARLDTGVKVGRIYNDDFKHTVEPRIRYNYVPKVKQEDMPSIYPDDIIGHSSDIFLNVDNRIWHKAMDRWGRTTARELLRVELTQGYDTLEEELLLFRFELETRPSEFFYLDFDTRVAPESGHFKSIWMGSTIKDSRKDSLSLSYRFISDEDEFANWSGRVRVWHEIYGLYFANYDAAEKIFIEHGGGIDIWPRSECWQLMLTAAKHTRPDDIKYSLQFKLVGLGSSSGDKRP